MFCLVMIQSLVKINFFKFLFMKKVKLKKIYIQNSDTYYIKCLIYERKNTKEKDVIKRVNKAMRKLEISEISIVLLPDRFKYMDLFIENGFEIYDESKFVKRFWRDALIFELKGRSPLNVKIGIYDAHFEDKNLLMAQHISKYSRSVYLVIKHPDLAKDIQKKIYEDDGISIVITERITTFKECDIIVSLSETFALEECLEIKRDTAILNFDPEFVCKKKPRLRILKTIKFKIPFNLRKEIPEGISQTKFIGALNDILKYSAVGLSISGLEYYK